VSAPGLDVEIRVEADPARVVAEELVRAARAGGDIALSGGSSPRPAYRIASRLEVRWGNVDLWFADDRCVPPADDRSNHRLVRETLLDGLAIPPTVHRIRGERSPQEASAQYDEELRGRTLDFVLLGIGADGHTASLFPRGPELDERERRAVAVEPRMEPFVPRVTMTIPVLAEAALALFLVTGEDKAEAVARAFGGEPSPDTPASLVRGRRTVAVLDAAAANRLV
jgi:6-phosphogluconolactonase